MNKILVIIVLSIFSSQASAETLLDMAVNFSSSYGSIANFVTAVTFVIGVGLVFASLINWAKVSDGSDREGLKKPISQFFIGVLLLNLMSTISIFASTIGITENPNILTAGTSGTATNVGAMTAGYMGAILGFVQIVGFIAFARGMLILHSFNIGQEREGMSRALTHLFGGTMAINIKWTVGVLANTFAPSMVGTFISMGIM